MGKWAVVFTVLAVLCVSRASHAQVPIDIEVSPNALTDTVQRRELSSGHVFTFSLRNYGKIGGPDARVTFSCGGVGVTVTCPIGTRFVPPAAPQDPAGEVIVTVTADIGVATTPITVWLTAHGSVTILDTTYTDQATGSWVLGNVVPATATLTPAARADTVARGASTNLSFTLTNTGAMATVFDIEDVAPACWGAVGGCTRTPAVSNNLAPGASQAVSYRIAGVAAGTAQLTPRAMLSFKSVATASISMYVVDATATVSPTAAWFQSPSTAQSFTGFTVSHDVDGPGATYQLSLTSTSGLNARFSTTGNATSSVTLSSATPTHVPTVLLDMPSSMGGFVTLKVAFEDSLLSSATLQVVGGAITPATAGTPAALGATGVQFSGLTIVGTPNTTFTAAFSSACTVVTNCRYANSASTIDLNTGAGGSVPLPVLFDAPASGAGTVPLQLRFASIPVGTATVNVTVSSGVSVVPQPATSLVPPVTSGQSQGYSVVNAGGAIANVTFAHNCGSLGAVPAATSCTVTPSSIASLPAGTTTVTIDYTSGAAGASSLVSLTATATALSASGAAAIHVPRVTLTPPAPPAPVTVGAPRRRPSSS